MDKFINGEINLLVSTTVIEVGIDNPNATVMIIENAEDLAYSITSIKRKNWTCATKLLYFSPTKTYTDSQSSIKSYENTQMVLKYQMRT